MELLELAPEAARLALWSIFPTVESFLTFKKEQQNSADNLIEYAFKKQIIQKKTESEFLYLIKEISVLFENRKPSVHYTFENIIQAITDKDLSVAGLVRELKILAEQLGFGKDINAAFFTRLRKDFNTNTLKQRSYIRLLALWIGIRKPEISFNYELLAMLPKSSTAPVDTTEEIGVLLTFAPRGKEIQPNTMGKLKDELGKCIHYLKLDNRINMGNIAFSATKLTVSIPKSVPKRELTLSEDPRFYTPHIQNALSIAHYMSIQWDFADYTNNASLIVAIEVGYFSKIENTIEQLLDADLPLDCSFRLSSLAYSAAQHADLKVIFAGTKYYNIWEVKLFWSFAYYETPEAIMSNLPQNDNSYNLFKKGLYFSEQGLAPEDTKLKKIFQIIQGHPHKISTILEIAKALILKRMYHEAIAILANVLSFERYNLIARTLRMQVLNCLGMGEENYDVAALFFELSINEGLFVEKYCTPGEEFYAEWGLVYWGKGQKIIKLLRKSKELNEIRNEMRKVVFDCLRKADDCFKQGMTLSTTGADNRNVFWWLHVNAFIRLLEKDEDLLENGKRPLSDSKGVYEDTAQLFFKVLGWGESGTAFQVQRMDAAVKTYFNSISSKSYLPNVSYAVATLIWDFLPKNKELIDNVLFLLRKAITEARELKNDPPLGIYTCGSACCISVITTNEFIDCVQIAIENIEKIKEKKLYSTPMKLFLLNIEKDLGSAPITAELLLKEKQY